MANAVNGIVTALGVAIALIIGILVVGQVGLVSQPGIAEEVEYDAVGLEETDTFVAFNDGLGTEETVWKTTGFALELKGASDSYATSDGAVSLGDDANFTLSTWASVDELNANMTALSYDGRVMVQYLDGNWSGWYYDESDRNSYRVNISASTPTERTLVSVTANGTDLTIYENTTQGETANITSDLISDSTLNTTNWNGTLEETKGYATYSNSSQVLSLYDTPIEPQTRTDKQFRVMWDQPNRNQFVLYDDASIDVSNGKWVAGFPEQEMQRKGFLGGGDYEWQKDGPRIKPLSGGDLDGFPVAYASYEFDTALDTQIEGISYAFELAAIIPILIVAGILIGVVSKFG